MEYLNELYKCLRQIERELKLAGRCRERSQLKRSKTATTGYRIKEFESRMLRLKSRWGGVMSNIFNAIFDLGVYDKIAHDLTKCFLTFHNRYDFDSDEISYAFRCTILPVTGQILDEEELGKKAFERQERRRYFLSQLLSCIIPGLDFARPRQETPSLDGSIDVCSESPRHEPGSARIQIEIQNESQRMVSLKPTPLTVIIIDILVEAVDRHARQTTRDDFSARDRIYHVMNIPIIIQLLKQHFADIQTHLEQSFQNGLQHNLDLLIEPICSYEQKFSSNLNLFNESNPMTLLRHQLDLLLFHVKLIKTMLKK